MADNITIPTTGTGTATPVVATDDVAGVHYQYIKLADGTLDSTAKIAGDATNGLDVDVTRSVLPTGASTETTVAAVSGKLPATLGQKAMAASMAVVVASDQSAVPVSVASLPLPAGAATEATLVAESAKLPATLGQKAMTASMAVVVASDQSAVPISAASLPLPSGASTEATLSAMSAKLPASLGAKTEAASLSVVPASFLHIGRFNTFRIPGRAGTTGQKILAIHNATGSSVTLRVDKIWVDTACTVVKAVTVLPPVVRVWKVTVVPTNGTNMTKVKVGGTGASNASVTVWGDASADGTGSGTALTATLPAGTIVTQEFAPRLITAAGYEMSDRIEFLGDFSVDCGPLEGIVVFLDYTLATQNPVTDMWVAGAAWSEF